MKTDLGAKSQQDENSYLLVIYQLLVVTRSY